MTTRPRRNVLNKRQKAGSRSCLGRRPKWKTRLAVVLCLAAIGCGDELNPTVAPAVDPSEPISSKEMREPRERGGGGSSAEAEAKANRANAESVEHLDAPENAAADAPRRSAHPIDQSPLGRAYRLALDAIDLGELSVARRTVEALGKDPQFGVLAEAIRGNLYVAEGKADQAMEVAESISRVPVMRAESYMIAAGAFRLQGQWKSAAGAYQEALRAHPQLVRAHRWLGVLLHDLGAMRDATKHLRRAADLDPTEVRCLRLAGRIQYEYENYPEAIIDFRRALTRQPAAGVETAMRVELAHCLRELREFDEAFAVLEPCERQPAVLLARGQVEAVRGNRQAALQLLREARAKDDQRAAVHRELGRVLMDEGETALAIKGLQRAVELQPGDHEARFLLGRSLVKSGQVAEGKAALEEAKRYRGIFLQMAELHLEAIDAPEDAAIRFQLGELAEQLQRPQLAASWYRAALGLDGDHKAAREALQRLL